MLAALLLLHWAVVLGTSLPLGDLQLAFLRMAPTLPVLDTHQWPRPIRLVNLSPLFVYLDTTAQYQNWSMFTTHSPNTQFLEIHWIDADGGEASFALHDQFPAWLPRRRRWMLVESALCSPKYRENYLPAAVVALVQKFAPGAKPREIVVKLAAYPLPLLEPDGSGNPLFSGSAAWRRVVDNPQLFVRLDIARLKVAAP